LYDSSPSPLLIQRKRTPKTTNLGIDIVTHKALTGDDIERCDKASIWYYLGVHFLRLKGVKNNLVKPRFSKRENITDMNKMNSLVLLLCHTQHGTHWAEDIITR
jgi:hypothetical protein